MATNKLAQFLIARYGSVGESRTQVGEPATVRAAYRRLQTELYAK